MEVCKSPQNTYAVGLPLHIIGSGGHRSLGSPALLVLDVDVTWFSKTRAHTVCGCACLCSYAHILAFSLHQEMDREVVFLTELVLIDAIDYVVF